MPGGDDDLVISGRLEGDLDEALRRIEQRLDSVEDSLGSAGRAGQDAGSDIAAGADKGKRALDDLGDEADEAAESLDAVRERAERGAKALRDAAEQAESAGDNLDDTARSAKAAASGLDDVAGDAREAGASLGATAKGGAAAATELGHTAREASKAARALDDAGDEAAESGAKAAASALLWERMAARIDRGERVSRRWAATQRAMRWSSWTSSIGAFFTGAKRITSGIDWDGTAKRVGKLSKSFGGFGKVMTALKFGAIAQGIYVLLGLLSALGAGAVGAVGGLLSLSVGLAAIAPLALTAKLALLGVKAALKECEPETEALKKKFEGFGTSIAAGGLRSGLQQFTRDVTELAGRVNTLGKKFGEATKYLLEDAGSYVKSAEFLQRYEVIVGKMPGTLLNMGYAALTSGKMLVNGLAAASPAANELSGDLYVLMLNWRKQSDALYESGRMTQVITQGYYNLRRALAVVADWTVGLFRIFKIAAQESAWMGDSIERSAQKFRDWTGTIEGQNSIRKYFQDAMPAVREAGLLVRDVFMGFGAMAANQDLAPLLNQIRTELLPALIGLAQNIQGNLVPGLVEMATHLLNIFSGLDFSGLQVLVDGINALLKAVIWAQQNIPGFNFLLSTLLSIMFLLGPVAWVASKAFGVFGKIGSAFSWISKAKAGTGELTRMQKIMGPLFQWVGRLAGWFGQVVGRALLWVFTAFTRLGGIMGILRMIGAAFMALVGIIGWPITIAIAVVALLVGAFIWLWNNCEWFREGVKSALSAVGGFFVSLWQDYVWPALKAVGDFFVWLWQSVIVPVAQGIWTVLKFIGAILFVILVGPFLVVFNIISSIVVWWYENVMLPVFHAVGDLCVWLFYNVIQPAVDFFVWLWNTALMLVQFAYYAYVVPALTAMGVFFSWIFNTVIMGVVNFFVALWNATCIAVQFAYYAYIVPALNAIGALFTWIFNNVIMPVVNFFVWLWNTSMLAVQIAYYQYIVPVLNMFAAILNWLWLNVAAPVINGILYLWNMLQAGIYYVYYTYIQPAFDAIGAGLDGLRNWFQSVVDGIGGIWNGLKAILAKPVNFLINTVWNEGIVKAWNWAAGLLGLPLAAPMAPIPENAKGGVMPGYTPGRDNQLSWVSGGEAIMRPEWTRAMGADYVNDMNATARMGGVTAVRRKARQQVNGPMQKLFGGDRDNPGLAYRSGNALAFADGGVVPPTLGKAQSWAQSQAGKPYVWGGGGPGGYDCSGIWGALTGILAGGGPNHGHPFGTGAFGSRGTAGFVPGMGTVTVGVSSNTGQGIGHMAGSLGNMNVESRGGVGVLVGPRAAGPTNSLFPKQFFLPAMGDVFMGSAGDGGGWFDVSAWVRDTVNGMVDPLLDALPHAPPQWLDVIPGVPRKAKDSFIDWAIEKLQFMGGDGGSGVSGTGPVADQVRAVARRYGWDQGPQWSAIDWIVGKESSWNPTNKNPDSSAYGLFQIIDGTWNSLGVPGDRSNPTIQAEAGLKYIKQRYNDPIGAKNFHMSRGWYDNGGYLPTGMSMVMNGTGSPEPVFTGAQWDILSSSMPLLGGGGDLVSAMLATPQSPAALAASGHDGPDVHGQLAELSDAVHELAGVVAERPPPVNVFGDEVRKAVREEMDAYRRRQRAEGRYKYGKKG